MPMRTWTTLEELADDPAVAARRKREFDPAVAAAIHALREEHGLPSEPPEDDAGSLLPAADRRTFLKLSGAAAVLGLAGCWHESPESLVPYVQQPEGTTIGEPRWYSTALRIGGRPLAVVAKSYDGRPIKLEGNPDHPQTGGGRLSLAGQAAILDLYDPDRCRTGPELGAGLAAQSASWDAVDEAAAKGLGSGEVVLLTGPVDGPATMALLAQVQQAFGGRLRHVAWHPFAQDVARQARGLSFGPEQARDPIHHWDRARVVVALGSDLLGGGTTALEDAVAFGAFRRKDEHGIRGQLIAFEATLSQTGTVADLRHRVDMEDLEGVAWAIAIAVAGLLGEGAPALPAGAEARAAKAWSELSEVKPHGALADLDPIQHAAQALVDHRGRGIVYVGGASHCGERSLGLHLAANWLNAALGNEGACIEMGSAPEHAAPASRSAFTELIADCAAGAVAGLIVWGANPVYDSGLPAETIAAAFGKVPTVVALAERRTETAQFANVFMPTSHDLESWGDNEWRRGVYGLQQPLVRPLWDNRQAQDSLMAIAARIAPGTFTVEPLPVEPVPALVSRSPLWQAAAHGLVGWQAFLQEHWQKVVHRAIGTLAVAPVFWHAALATGLVTAPAAATAAAVYRLASLDAVPAPVRRTGMSLVLSASRSLGDGSQANNAYLQEAPDPVSKVTWDNYVSVALPDAYRLGLQRNQLVGVTVAGKQYRLPAVLQPGQKAGTIEVFLGWGRTAAGAVANDVLPERAADDGLGQAFNAYPLAADGQRWGIPAELAHTGIAYQVAETQHHNYMDGRDIALADPQKLHAVDADGTRRMHAHFLWQEGSGTLNRSVATGTVWEHQDRLDKTEGHGGGGRLSLWDHTHVYPGRRWGMSIDLSTCIGCNACVVACQVENNVPVVGRDEVRIGREMHWMRIDRYYSSPDREVSDLAAAGTDAWDRRDQHYIEGQEGGSARDPEHLEVIHQPMLCQHCGHAPCEEVCPPMATMHNEEGVNLQIYNRCIGTRFCANNCPYKVRRFNFYEYSKLRIGPQGSAAPLDRVVRNLTKGGQLTSTEEGGTWQAPLALLWNPEVTVRTKGVMEKCNFCVQRTRTIRELEKRSGQPYDDTVPGLTTACAQTCPTQAIVFGDINDPFSVVNELLVDSPHRYRVLDPMLNTRPSVQYLRAVRNRPLNEEELETLQHISTKPAPADAAEGH